MKKYWLTTFALAAFLILPGSASSATLVAGDLVKLPDDGNPATTADSAVYYFGADGKRYVFPSDKTYFTWYNNFDSVKVIDAATMASLQLGGNATYRPGIRMVKIISSPKVYAVAKNGTLRPLADEATAAKLYGSTWNTMIDDISDAFFINYAIGAEVNTSSSYTPTSESAASPTIGVDKNLGGSQVVELPTSNDKPEFTIEARPVPSKGPFVAGSVDVTFGVFVLQASTTAVNVVKRLRFASYIDEREGGTGFSEHVDNDDGTPKFAHQMLTEVGLYDASGNQLAAPKGLDSGSVLDFSGLNIQIQPGQELEVHLRGGVSLGIEEDILPDRFAFDINTISSDVTVTDLSGGAIVGSGANPNGGTSATYFVEIVGSGSMTFEWKGESGNVIAGREALLGTLEIQVDGEDFALEQLTLHATGLLESIVSYRLEFLKSDDSVQNVTSLYLGNLTTVSHLPFILEKGRTNPIKVFATLKTRNNSFYNENIRLEVLSTDPMKFHSIGTGKVYDQSAFVSQFSDFALSGLPTNFFVRFSAPTFSLVPGSPAGPIGKGQATNVLNFRITAEPEGGVRIKHLTFKLVPGDTETSGGNNDALEKWADINGDGPDDNDIVNLYQISPPKEDVIGEDSTARLKYSIVDDGVKNETPSTIITSTKNDYALIEYDFVQDQELKIPAGASVDYRLELDTTQFAIDTHSLEVSILGSNDIQWTDLYTGNYPIISGELISGLPLKGSALTVQ